MSIVTAILLCRRIAIATRGCTSRATSSGAQVRPLRVAILELLTIHGPMTATALGESPANCPWHLRRLAEHEHRCVAEAEGGRGGQRPWRTVHVGFNWGNEDIDPPARPAADALSRMMLSDDPSARLARRVGMRHEAHLRQDCWCKGEWTDTLIYAVIGADRP